MTASRLCRLAAAWVCAAHASSAKVSWALAEVVQGDEGNGTALLLQHDPTRGAGRSGGSPGLAELGACGARAAGAPEIGVGCYLHAGGIKAEAPSYRLIQEDALTLQDPAMNLLQRASWGKAARLAATDTNVTGEPIPLIAMPNKSMTGKPIPLIAMPKEPQEPTAQSHLDSQAWRAQKAACAEKPGGLWSSFSSSSSFVPMSMEMQLQRRVFRDLGLLERREALPRCPGPALWGFFSFHAEALSVDQVNRENRIAKWISISFMILLGALLARSLFRVFMVSARKDKEQLGDKSVGLICDEGEAMSRGWIYWASMDWVDNLIGFYGKVHGALVENEEICAHDSEFSPHVAFRNAWNEEVAARGMQEASVGRVLLKVVGWRSCTAIVVANALDLLGQSVGAVLALDVFLDYLEDMNNRMLLYPDEPQSVLKPTILAVVLLCGIPTICRYCSITVSMLDGYYGTQLAACMAGVVYEKALKLSGGTTGGGSGAAEKEEERPNLVQLLNTDIYEAWQQLCQIAVNTLMAPVIFVVLLTMLVQQFDLPGFLAVLYCVPAGLLVGFISLFFLFYWYSYQQFQDKRLRYLAETLHSIRIVKSLAWERMAYNKLHSIRMEELKVWQKVSISMGCIGAALFQVPWFTLLITSSVTIQRNGDIQPHKILVLQRIMSALLLVVQSCLFSINKSITIPNSFRRIKAFLLLEERPEGAVRPVPSSTPSVAVRLQGSFSFSRGTPPVLKGLDVTIRKGELVAVCGLVASGKTSLLQAVIGELFPEEDAVVQAPLPESNKVAYCAQVPWIFEGTMRENIVMDEEFIPDRFYKSLYAASLTPDLHILPGGDQVTIGSRGIRLSGGQKARVALARAAYKQTAEVIVLDDPLASVDVPTADHIEAELFHGPLLKGKTRVVAIQPDPARLRRFDRVLLLEAGELVFNGPPAEALEKEAFKKLQAQSAVQQREGLINENPARGNSTTGAEETASVCRRKEKDDITALRDAEERDYVTWDTYLWWLKKVGMGNLVFFFVTAVVNRFLALMTQFVLADWVNDKLGLEPTDNHYYMMMILYLTLITSVLYVVMCYAASKISWAGAVALHAEVVWQVLRAPVDKFFDKQPVGRLLNRLSLDMRAVDDAIANLLMFIFNFVVATLITQVYAWRVSPLSVALGSIVPWLAIIYFLYLFKNTAVPMMFHSKFAVSHQQDLQSVVMVSCTSIRVNSMLQSFLNKYNQNSGVVMASNYVMYGLLRAWIQSRVFLVMTVLTTAYTLGGLWEGMPMGTLSTVITLQFSTMSELETTSGYIIQWLGVMNALQRLTSFFDVPQEAAEELPGDPRLRVRATMSREELVGLEIRTGEDAAPYLPPGWPCQVVLCTKDSRRALLRASSDGTTLEPPDGGLDLQALAPSSQTLQSVQESYNVVAVNSVSKDALRMAQELAGPASVVWVDMWDSRYVDGVGITLENLTAGYGSDQDVLHNISITIPPRLKVGFAGKTGCGKSSTLLCLLRILELRSGGIKIGSWNIRQLGLNCLRSLIGLVPQDATIFAGTWRRNIDPFDEFPDGKVWDALQCVQLLPFVRALEGGIESEVVEDGANMSFGQRQLLSLARMVIRQPPILLLDECTSALDPATQAAAQHALLHEFPLSTIVAIAHRVETLLDFDRIVVLSNGSVAEEGTVKEVMSIENGIFAEMVKGSDAKAKLGLE